MPQASPPSPIRHQVAGWSDFNTKLKILKSNPSGGGVGYVTFARPDGVPNYCADLVSGCLGYYPAGSTVTLTAYGNSEGLFTGWSGACAGTSKACTVTASFVAGVALTVSRLGVSGGGFVEGGNIGCGFYVSGQAATGCTHCLQHQRGFFARWCRACNGVFSTACTVTMDASQTVTAEFAASVFGWFVAKAGNGDGKDDIVWRNMGSGNVVLSLMSGNVPTWQSVRLY